MSVATAAPSAPALGALAIDPVRRRANVAGAELYLSESEFTLLSALATEPGRVFSYEELLTDAFAGAPGVSASTIDAYGQRLSRKLELRGMSGRLSCEADVGLRLELVRETVDSGGTR